MWSEDYKRWKIFPGVPLGFCALGVLLILDPHWGGTIKLFIAAICILFGLTFLVAGIWGGGRPRDGKP